MVEHEDLNSQEHNDDLLVFPPINHENLYTDGFDMERESSPTPSSSSSFGSDVIAKLLHQIVQMNELLIEKKHSN
uniref:Uncharacterized protein n=1 Tax=Brassica campestris TaxID=3711 RepID=M4D906_BRACM